MQVRAGRTARRTDQTDTRVGLDQVAGRHVDAIEVGVEGAHAVGMADFDEPAVTGGVVAGAHHRTLGGDIDAGPLGRGDIDALMPAGRLTGQTAQAEDRVDRITPDGGDEGDQPGDRASGLGHRSHRRSFGRGERLRQRGDIGRRQGRREGHGHDGDASQNGGLAGVNQERPGGRQQASHGGVVSVLGSA